MGPIWGRQDPGGPHVGPMNFAIWAVMFVFQACYMGKFHKIWIKISNIFFKKVNLQIVAILFYVLTHWDRVKHICISKLTMIVSDNGLSPGWHQAIIWVNVGIFLIGPLGTKFSEILIKIYIFSLKTIHLKMSSGKLGPFCHSLDVWKADNSAKANWDQMGSILCPVLMLAKMNYSVCRVFWRKFV